MKFPKLIEVESNGLTIDGERFPWSIAADPPPTVRVGPYGSPSVTVRLIAEQIKANTHPAMPWEEEPTITLVAKVDKNISLGDLKTLAKAVRSEMESTGLSVESLDYRAS